VKFVLDTSAFSACLREEEGIMSFLSGYKPGNFFLVPPVLAEIEYGIARLKDASKKKRLLTQQKKKFFDVFTVLPWTKKSSELFGLIKANLEKSGNLIDDFDIAVASIAMSHEAEVLTANLVHFTRVNGLKCSYWEK
jgi:tRNA(fMet)-specific endonuclease VapC